jgi:biopolymer transport protein ExbB/TolQ
MRFPEVVRMAEDGVSAPVWARSKKSGGGAGGFIGLIVFLLALFGVLILALAGMNHWSFAKAGGQIDGWVCQVVAKVHGGAAKTEAAADKAGDAAKAAGDKAADATKAGADKAGAAMKAAGDKVEKAADKATTGKPAKK